MKKVIEGKIDTISVNDIHKYKTYYVNADGDVYKLHRIDSSNNYVFISLQESECWMNGNFSSFEKAIKSTLKEGYEIFEIENLQDLITFLSNIKN